MSEVQSRPRGRGATRGRGGHSSRGGRTSRNIKPEVDTTPSFENEGEIGQLKKKHASNLNTLRELFPTWTDEDLVFAMEDADGDLTVTIERISEGGRALPAFVWC